MMIEQSIISQILETGKLDILNANGVTSEMFLSCQAEIDFILQHFEKYKQVPDKITFLAEFADFQMLEVSENTDYLIYKLKEAFMYTKLVPIIQGAADKVRSDSIEAIDYLKTALDGLERAVPVGGNSQGYDIISNAKDRFLEYKKRCEVKGLIGIPTGIPKLDELTNGWLWGEELVTITGRTNVGKSWMAEYFATVAFNLGYKILFYSRVLKINYFF